MMKRNILAVIVPALLVAGTANAAEIYNKDGNKVDLYGKAVGLHYFSKDLVVILHTAMTSSLVVLAALLPIVTPTSLVWLMV